MRHRNFGLRYLVLVPAVLLFAGPLVWLVVSSFKPIEDFRTQPHAFWPSAWQPNNYTKALTEMPFARYLENTLVYCVGSVVGTVFASSLAAYGFARLRWRGRDALFFLVIATLLLPTHVTMIPRFLLLRELGLYNHLAALIVPTFLGDAFSIFLLRQFFLTLPEELSEAARLDGLSEWGIYWRIVLPLARPALVTVAVFQWVAAWNDFQGPLLYLRDPDRFPLAYGLERFVSSYSDQTHLLLAAAVLFTAPLVVLFFLAQRAFVEGVATTGSKG